MLEMPQRSDESERASEWRKSLEKSRSHRTCHPLASLNSSCPTPLRAMRSVVFSLPVVERRLSLQLAWAHNLSGGPSGAGAGLASSSSRGCWCLTGLLPVKHSTAQQIIQALAFNSTLLYYIILPLTPAYNRNLDRTGQYRTGQGKEQFPDAVHPVVPAAYYPIEKVHDIG